MRAIVYPGPGVVSVQEVPTPRPAPDELLLRCDMTGVCGTDLHIHEGGFFSAYPLTPGHEIVGTVVEVGPGGDASLVGRRMAADNAAACGLCDACGRAEPLFCSAFRSLGVNAPGGFAEHVAVRADKCFDADDLPVETAVFAEPTACAMHGMDVLALHPGADVALVGSGPTGLLLAQLLLHGGAARLTVAGPTAFKLELARRFGVDRTVQVERADPEGTARVLRELSPEGYDVAIDATGSAAVMGTLPGLVRDGGTVLVYGMADESARVPFSPYEIFRRQLTIKESFAQVDCFDRALRALRSGRVRTEGMITHRFPLDRYVDALEAVRSDPTCLKAVLVPGASA